MPSPISPEVGKVTPRGSRQVNPKATTTYTLTVTGPNNTVVTKEVTVTVPGTTPVFFFLKCQRCSRTEAKKDCPGWRTASPIFRESISFGAGEPLAVARGSRARGGRGAAPAGPELKTRDGKNRVVRGPNDAGALSMLPIAGPAGLHRSVISSRFCKHPATRLSCTNIRAFFRIVPTNGATHPVDPASDVAGRFGGPLGGDTW